MKKLTFIFTLLFVTLFSFGQQVMISQYIEGITNHQNKGIEIYNYSGKDIVFSITNNLQIYKGENGNACTNLPGTEITSGTLSAGKVWVIGTDSADNLIQYTIDNGTDLSGTLTYGFSFNGNDSLEVYLGGVLQDVFGTCGTNPGTDWSGNGGGNGAVSTKNNNISLRDDVCKGSLVNWTDPSLRFNDGPNGSDMTGFGNAPVRATATYALGSWIGTPANTAHLIFDDNYTTGNNINACDCTINSGKTLTITDGKFLNVENSIFNDGIVVVEHQGSIVQINKEATVTGTNFQIKKTTTPYVEYDYTYWSSPVENADLHTVFAANIIGTDQRIFDFNTANFEDTDSNSYDDDNNDWNVASGAMTPAKGYIVMGSQYDWPFIPNSYTTGLTQTVSFNGKINNGDITIPVVVATTPNVNFSNDNLIGNPYPSAIDGELFLNHPENSELTGTLYFWSHNTPLPGSSNGTSATDDEAFNFTNNDYATFTTAGYAASISGSVVPTGKEIASGQGFFAPVSAAGTIKFTNAMRVTTGNDNFFRPAAARDRVWVNMTGDNSLFRQILIGFFADATNGNDRKYDGKRIFSGNQNVDFYTLLNNERYAIQGLPLLTNDKIIPLGINAPNTGTFTLSIDRFEGNLENTNIYIKDNLLNSIHNLKIADYNFDITQAGEFNNRLELIFTNNALATNNTTIVTANDLIISNQDNNIHVTLTNDAKITQVTAYDVLGKTIISANKTDLKATIANGTILIFKVTLKNGQILTKKFVKL